MAEDARSALPDPATTHCAYAASPVGDLLVAGSVDAVTWIGFTTDRAAARPRPGWVPGQTPLLREALQQLEAYFARRLARFDLPVRPAGTPFQQAVWRALQEIPYGQTRSYADMARAIGRPPAVRAVGAANGRNPVAIVIPCHRVIGRDGRLTGYGGGLPVKAALLALEGVRLA